ncbi:unnamed protein product, partial [Discosporangium mesarthrocarpum]
MDVSCTGVTTHPLYGFFANGVSIMVLLGGGGILLREVHLAAREVREAAELWDRDRIEISEMQARTKMI